jgi:hypothetical protein
MTNVKKWNISFQPEEKNTGKPEKSTDLYPEAHPVGLPTVLACPP